MVGAGFITRFQLSAMRLVRGMEVAGNTSIISALNGKLDLA